MYGGSSMTTLSEFINKWSGKKCDWDLQYGGQCFDLYRQYAKEVLNFPQSGATGDKGAAILWEEYDKDPVLVEHYEKISNSDTFIPQSGDIALWNRKFGSGYGHVAICTGKGDLKTFESFDQNWSKVSYCELVTHTYSSFYGVLRPKITVLPTYEQLTKDLAEQRQQVKNYAEQVSGWEKTYGECELQLRTAKDTIKGYETEIKTAKETLSTTFDCTPEWSVIFAQSGEAVTYKDKATELEERLTKEEIDHHKAISDLESKIASLESQLVSLKADLKAVKDTQITPSNGPIKYSIIDIIKSFFGIK